MNRLRASFGTVILSVASAALVSCAFGPQGLGRMEETLITPTYYISIRSPKGWDDRDVRFVVQDRRSRTIRVVAGRKDFVSCASKSEGPNCENLAGYSFDDGGEHYYITDTGRLTVKRDGHTVLWERGTWQEGNAAGQ